MELTTNNGDGTGELALTGAILLYGSRHKGTISMATQHDVLETGGRPVVGPGALLTKETVERALCGLVAAAGMRTWRFVDNEMVASGPGLIAWWTPEQTRHVHFSASTGVPSGPARQPAQFWIANRNKLYVYSLAESKRPDIDTRLYPTIHFNVYSGGNVCTGTMPVPVAFSTSAWVEAFYGSVFTHPNGGNTWQCNYRGGVAALWRRLIKEGGCKPFPVGKLASSRLTTVQAALELATQ